MVINKLFKKEYLLNLPYNTLLLVAVFTYLLLFINANGGVLDMTRAVFGGAVKLVTHPAQTLFTSRVYQWHEISSSRFIEENVPEGGSVLFINDQNSLGENFVYYNIYTYTEKKIKFFFDGNHTRDEEFIINKMKENKIEYIFSYRNPDPTYAIAKHLEDKSFLLKLVNNKLEVVAVHD